MPDYKAEYRKKLIKPREAARLVKSGDIVEYGMVATRPLEFDRALAERAGEEGFSGVRVRTTALVPPPPEIAVRDPEQRTFQYGSWYFTHEDRRLAEQVPVVHWPFNFHEVNRFMSDPRYREQTGADVWCALVTPMDQHGYFNFGLAASHNLASALAARVAVVEVNENLPRCLGGYEEVIHISQVDYIIESSGAPVHATGPVPPPTPEQKRIAELIVEEIGDGACLQLGIGALPNAIGLMLVQSDLKDLGIHSEMFCDAFVALIEAGKVTNARKSIDRYKSVYTFALGTRNTYDFLNDNPAAAACPASYTNDPARIRLNDNVVAINNILEVDLFGQVCSESKGTRQISGTGGQLDFTVGAFESRGGKSFLAFTSTYTDREGKVYSRVRPLLDPGSIVTVPRVAVNWLVTEYGKVNLKGMSAWERAESLINLAHPSFRDDLVREAEALGIWRRSNRLP